MVYLESSMYLTGTCLSVRSCCVAYYLFVRSQYFLKSTSSKVGLPTSKRSIFLGLVFS